MFTLDFDGRPFERSSTSGDLFEGEPDLVRQVIGNGHDSKTLLYFTENNAKGLEFTPAMIRET